MGKKTKIGKQRRDKYYYLSKETGLRSRAAFKLIQLNKRFEFLQRSRALVDLCAAPGGWLQVAAENMPVSSIRIGVDLVPIKPVKNCVTLQGDITLEKTRQAIKGELNNWEVDCVLHDGAPNIGQNWSHDAFEQNCLTLSALKLATQILKENGWFITKVFRSADYAALIQVFEKLFKKVHVWKPPASRLESAEIFVVCEKYLKPDKVDPDLLNIKTVFKQAENTQPDVNIHRLISGKGKIKKAKALGYDDDNLTMFNELKASEFVSSSDHLQLLAKASCIVLDEERFINSPYTTDEFKECIKDIRVCGGGDLRKILNWRKKIIEGDRKEREEAAKKAAAEIPPDPEAEEQRELEEIDELIRNASAAERAKLKKKKRIMLKNKKRLQERKQLGMVHEGDRIDENLDYELFNLNAIRKSIKLSQLRKATTANHVEKPEHDDEKPIEAFADSAFGKEQDVKLSDDEIEDTDRRVAKRKKPTDDDEEDDEAEKPKPKKQKKVKLTPVQLAMGEKMIYSSKTRSELEDWAWNRYTSNDTGLPDWFVEDEKKHRRAEPPVSRDRIAFYKERALPLNSRPIKAVVEAKMRKKKRQLRRLERAKKQAEGMLENEQMDQSEKIREVKKLYKKALKPEKREIKYVRMTKGRRGRVPRPGKGRYKVVDSRMKKDLRSQKAAAKRNDKSKSKSKVRVPTGRAKRTARNNKK